MEMWVDWLRGWCRGRRVDSGRHDEIKSGEMK
jgi:hypothetical protein